ncbi:unnamed protein product [Phytophthora fragariaefolia]|uniref:Unnamed protein product n=1 Tax=Phytophthora fragariaefolia TaxID=1490495 RepID=A0A9W6Y2F7_9STRA|nr:unnamed protein product [Phytophthora fragariaefolia]
MSSKPSLHSDHIGYDGSDYSVASAETVILGETPDEALDSLNGEENGACLHLIGGELQSSDVQVEEPTDLSLGNKSITYQGYSYAWYYTGSASTNYRRSVYRWTGCKAKLIVKEAVTEVSGEHELV